MSGEKNKKNFWEDEKLSRDEKNEALKEICRKVFSTDEGKIVLNMLLSDLRVFEKIDNEEHRRLNEYGKFLIRERLGVRGTKPVTDFIAETAARGGR